MSTAELYYEEIGVTELYLPKTVFPFQECAKSLSRSIFSAQPLRVENRTILEPEIQVLNIPFRVTGEEEGVFLENHEWPILTAAGASFPEALENLRSLLATVIKEYVFVSEEELAEDAIRFRRYLVGKLL